ncbi:hypothetical protein BDF20DRAFT_841418 [Mycotypha africana]|uniref:uncharacterized protein n=1 Tax=Mycotypha africana TaxID=64632 RepID=UPI0023015224|nr:uncharacterized protein BDF20DRAFT_841418 [Mycotypha africana]KAI8990902.1 hypothetical protein BDF20DRAFT_841418 [Mycotypha africana]
MGITINSPLPASLASECRKAARILNSFTDDGRGVDFIIPPHILKDAKGLAIFTVLKAGFLFSGRAGSGVVVAKLPNGSWSAPAAIMTGGMGFGGQVGAELTDFIMVLNTTAAVKTFMHHGSITLGGNISVAAGPVGRNAEASAAASIKAVSAVYSYSKTRGVFAGVSLEGSVIFERFDANKKLYGTKVSVRELLNGTIPPPASADPLYRALELKSAPPNGGGRFGYMDGFGNNSYRSDYNNYNSSSFARNEDPYSRRDVSDSNYQGSNFSNSNDSAPNRTMSFSRGAVHTLAKSRGGAGGYSSSLGNSHRPRGSSTSSWRSDDYYEYDLPRQQQQQQRITSPPSPNLTTYGNNSNSNQALVTTTTAVKTNNNSEHDLRARALFNFSGQQDGDLPFKKGDIITIVHKSNTQNDWWTGRIGYREGIFPANFVEIL